MYDTKDVINEITVEGVKSFDVMAIGQSLSVSISNRIIQRETCKDAAQRRFNARFGLGTDTPTKQVIPQYVFDRDSLVCDFHKTLIHEAGHIFDFANDLVSYRDDWISMSFKKIPNEYPQAKVSSLFFSENTLEVNDAEKLLTELNQSPFVTLYAVTHPMEDFAEEFANMFGKYDYVMLGTDGKKLVDIRANNLTVQSRIKKSNYIIAAYTAPDKRFKIVPTYKHVGGWSTATQKSHLRHSR